MRRVRAATRLRKPVALHKSKAMFGDNAPTSVGDFLRALGEELKNEDIADGGVADQQSTTTTQADDQDR